MLLSSSLSTSHTYRYRRLLVSRNLTDTCQQGSHTGDGYCHYCHILLCDSSDSTHFCGRKGHLVEGIERAGKLIREMARKNEKPLGVGGEIDPRYSSRVGYETTRAETFPERAERPVRPGILAPYETYLCTRWIEGERNAVGFFRELTDRGYTGSRMTIERFLLGLRRMEQQGMEVSQAATSVELKPRRAVGLMLRSGLDLTEEEQTALRQVCQIHPQVKRLNAFFQDFA